MFRTYSYTKVLLKPGDLVTTFSDKNHPAVVVDVIFNGVKVISATHGLESLSFHDIAKFKFLGDTMQVELLEQIEKTPSTNSKVELLKQLDTETIDLIKCALSKSLTYGVTVDEDDILGSAGLTFASRTFWTQFKVLLDVLSQRVLTGNDAISEVHHVLRQAPSPIDLKWACRILNRDLRAGFNISLLNRVLDPENAVEKFGVQLAETYDPADNLQGQWFVERKLDGNRVILYDELSLSRSGKIYQQGQDVITQIIQREPDFFQKWVLDGEMMGDLGFDKSSGALRRTKEKTQAKFTYWVFDIVPRDVWDSKGNSESLVVRKQHLEQFMQTHGSEIIQIVPYEVAINPNHAAIMKYVKDFMEAGFEGAMLKDAHSSYKFKREKNLFKAKLFEDIDVPLIDIYEGNGKYKGSLGGIVVEHKGIKTKVGSGFPDDLRREIWENKQSWLGAIVQIQYQGVGSKGAFRFPVFVMRRKDKE